MTFHDCDQAINGCLQKPLGETVCDNKPKLACVPNDMLRDGDTPWCWLDDKGKIRCNVRCVDHHLGKWRVRLLLNNNRKITTFKFDTFAEAVECRAMHVPRELPRGSFKPQLHFVNGMVCAHECGKACCHRKDICVTEFAPDDVMFNAQFHRFAEAYLRVESGASCEALTALSKECTTHCKHCRVIMHNSVYGR